MAPTMEGILHVYHPTRDLLLFEHIPRPQTTTSTTSSSRPPNTLLFIGGMYDNFLNPAYTTSLSALFPRHPSQSWSVIHVQLSSALRSFGTSSLSKDADEIRTAIDYIRTNLHPASLDTNPQASNIVLLGHSTGCQDIMHYLTSPNPPAPNKPSRPAVQGAILQAPASDRDAALNAISEDTQLKSLHDSALTLSRSTPESQHQTTILPLHLTSPLFGPAPLSISRFLSLLSPDSPSHPGADDFFSEDATPAHLQNTFGSVGSNNLLKPAQGRPKLLALMSADDEFVPAHIDKAALLGRWTDAMRGSSAEMHGDSGVIAHGSHALSGEDVDGTRARLVDFRSRVVRYLDEVVGGVDGAWDVIRADEEALKRREAEKGDNDTEEVEKGVGGMKL